MSYNEERLEIARQIDTFAEVGFMAQVREIADALSICSREDVKAIADKLMGAIRAMESIEEDIAYHKKFCEEGC